MLNVFGDESSDESKQRVFAVVGVIGPAELWEPLEKAWVERTRGVPFHANHCDSDQGDYKGNPHSENKALYKDLATLLAGSGLVGYGVAIDLAAQRQVFPNAADMSYYKGFIEVLQAMKRFAEALKEPVKFSFDSRQESEYNAGMLYGSYRNSPDSNGHLFPEISFLDSSHHPSIQVADLMAREAMKLVDNQFGPIKRAPRKSWLALYETGMFVVDYLSLEWFSSLKRQMPSLQKATGIDHLSYWAWLSTRKLDHNITNLFRFADYNDKKEPAGP